MKCYVCKEEVINTSHVMLSYVDQNSVKNKLRYRMGDPRDVITKSLHYHPACFLDQAGDAYLFFLNMEGKERYPDWL